jgi:hypothetical protein
MQTPVATRAMFECERIVQEILHYGQLMLIHAKEANWDAVNVLDKRRAHAIHALFSSEIPNELVLSVAINLEEMQRVQSELLATATAERSTIANELIKLKNAGKRAQSYSEFNRFLEDG